MSAATLRVNQAERRRSSAAPRGGQDALAKGFSLVGCQAWADADDAVRPRPA
jgi:hypothetical protein